MTTGFLFDEQFLSHNAGANHPECKERLLNTITHLRKQEWYPGLKQIQAHTPDEYWIHKVHSKEYFNRAKLACRDNHPFLDSVDVGICPDSFRVALLAAGSALALTDQVINGEIDNGFALLRPPGHHAEPDIAMGFCMFNNVAIMTRYMQKKYNIGKVLILDWDVHHGNGIQHIFEEDPSVLYISTHQYPFYPGTGAFSETGFGRGKGATLNCPMKAGSTDYDYEKVFMEKILPGFDKFKPDFIIISAGFDAHREDPLAEINLSTSFFGWMTERVMEKADKYCQGRIISLLEGGYNLDMLPLCIGQHLIHLSGIATDHIQAGHQF